MGFIKTAAPSQEGINFKVTEPDQQREGSYECECVFSCMNAPVYVF